MNMYNYDVSVNLVRTFNYHSMLTATLIPCIPHPDAKFKRLFTLVNVLSNL